MKEFPGIPVFNAKAVDRHVWLLLQFLVLSAVAIACGDEGSNPSGPDDPLEQAVAVITGPGQLSLGCLVGVKGTFSSSESTGPIQSFQWEVDGAEVGQGSSLEYMFRERGEHQILLTGRNSQGEYLPAVSKSVSVLPTSDAAGCLAETRILGRGGVLLRTGMPSVTVEYTLNTADQVPGSVTNYRWTVKKGAEAAKEVASGADAHTVGVVFTEGGDHEIAVELTADGAPMTRTLPVKVYTGEPVSEPGTIVFQNRPDSDGTGGRSGVPGFYLMDGETGHVTGPIISTGGALDLEGLQGSACDTERVVFIGTYQAADYGALTWGLFQVDHSGTGLRLLEARSSGIIQHPDLNKAGDVAFIDDARWNRKRDELVIHTYWGETFYASGAQVDTLFNGFRPSWSPDGGRVALASTKVNPISFDGRGGNRLSIYRVAGHGQAVELSGTNPPEFPFRNSGEFVWDEGTSGIAWDPRGEFLAYVVTVQDTQTLAARFPLVLWRIGTGDFRVVADNAMSGRISWSPNGEYLLYSKGTDAWSEPGIWQVPRGGGEPVNLSAITMDGANDRLGDFCLNTG